MSALYVIETSPDAVCKTCTGNHGYVTKGCELVVFTNMGDAFWVNAAVDGIVRPIRDVPDGISYQLFVRSDEG